LLGQAEEESLKKQQSIQEELKMRKTVENKGLLSEKAQEYQQYLESHKQLMGEEDLKLLREPHSIEEIPESPRVDDNLETGRKVSFKTEDSYEDNRIENLDIRRKMTMESGKADSTKHKESRFK